MTDLTDLIKKHEGLRLKPYRCTAGKLTIGYGRNLDDAGITTKEAELMLHHDILAAIVDAHLLFPTISQLSKARQAVLVNMTFNLGKIRMAEFRLFRAAVGGGLISEACKQMLDSDWARQVPTRAHELANLWEKGEW